ncbi:Acg family FMN-binding oxidoreductase [Wenjunlia tyrosinilytica]|uniref:Nitroreductase family protein n=1 Tax=Wenjunlia tyrosinilytica TaxID=1544741 RepID=A0A917ZX62_9ACTN|nr:hypothetical protein [Wenjunlia tyrosinilytica]GGO98964.1 hypothetical protein GCM10012280_64310 [Wenjunlia tyrosinilytica]
MKTKDRTLDAAALEKLISAAVAAPSMHNTQPWRYRLDSGTRTLELHAATERAVRHADPNGRALRISAGASLFNLRVAADHLGWEPVVRLLPDPGEPTLLATVRLAGPPRADTHGGRDLYEAIWRRHSSRFPFSDRRLPAEVVNQLIEAARAEGACAHFPGTDETCRLLELTAEGERRNLADSERRGESDSWVRERADTGIPPGAVGPLDAGAHLPMRSFTEPGFPRRPPPAVFEPRPLIAVLTTAFDGPGDWLRSGQALQRILLVATANGVRASLLHQALEWPDLRWALRDTHDGPEHAQMLIRLGYGPSGPTTPRRSPQEVLDDGPR